MEADTAIVTALVLLMAANATPVVVAKLLNERWAWPLDFGCVLPDGDRLFGSHKTWRGLAAGILATTVAAGLLQVPLWVGASFAAASLIADALSSAVKRRMHVRPGTEVLGLDQFGEAVVPLVLFSRPLSLDVIDVAIVAVLFSVLDIGVAWLRHRSWRR